MKKFFLTAFLAALGLATPAMAQVSANLGDLILGFRATGGQGQNVNLEVNLGSVAQFQGQAAGTTLLISRLPRPIARVPPPSMRRWPAASAIRIRSSPA